MFNLDQIDTRIGTASVPDFSHGNTLPLTGVPFGMNYLAVQTTFVETSWWFDPSAPTFAGIRLTHQPSPWIGDFQHLTFVPLTTPTSDVALGAYRPQEAIFSPHYLRVHELSQDVTVEATNGLYGGQLALHAQAPLTLRIVLPDRSQIAQLTPHEIIIKTQNFSDAEDSDFAMFTTIRLSEDATMTDLEVGAIKGAFIDLPLHTQTATISFATSFISTNQAQRNLAPIADQTFAAFKQTNAKAWESRLGTIDVTDHHPQRVSTFYHNLYRAFLFPMRFYEEDEHGQAIHYNTTARQVAPGKLFTNNGFWDTYKTVFPLFSLIAADDYADFLAGFLTSYQETGFLPRWLSPDERGMMPGTMVDAVIADAAIKGIAPELMPTFLTAMIHGAETVSDQAKYGREGLKEYLTLGYVPSDIHESVNKTLDYAYSDWLISVVATHLHQKEVAAKYAARSHNWQHLYDPQVRLMHPKTRAGAFTADFDAITWGNGFTEGSAWQNSFAVYQDIPGLIQAFGGDQAFIAQLRHLVNQPAAFRVGSYGTTIHEMREMAALDFGQLAISNQPSFHLPYLFALAGDSEDTEITTKQLATTVFSDRATGYPGDEDNGSMASWYLLTTLGFYPVTPGSGDYVFGNSLFDQACIHLANGNTLTITTQNNHDHLNYVGTRTFNGTPTTTTISHQQLMQGGHLVVSRQLLPNQK